MTAKKVNVNVTRKPAVTGPVRELKVPVRVSEPAPVSDIDTVLADRGSRYGTFESNARVAQNLKEVMRSGSSWSQLTLAQKEGLDMIQHKVARMVNGDPTYLDNIVDILGYGTLIRSSMESSCGE
jgi:Domain of unknown function (DUF6378)